MAQTAADAGYVPLVADFFADSDTQAIAHRCLRLPGEIAQGFQPGTLTTALDRLTAEAPLPVLGLVYGSGFEDRTGLLATMAARWPLLGNDPQTVARLKDPRRFFEHLDRLSIPHPETTTKTPNTTAGWLAKRPGGAGGGHIQPLGRKGRRNNVYYQRQAAGRPVSALFVADGREARVIGFSEQWTAPVEGKPWRYGGAVQPAPVPQGVANAMTDAVSTLTRACGLKGLASADFVLPDAEPLLLEVNPRPGATLDIFASRTNPLLALHVAAVRDAVLPEQMPGFDEACASAVLYAPEPLTPPRGMVWPCWAADIPAPGQRIDKHRPICTVLARAGSGVHAKERVEARLSSLLARIQDERPGVTPGPARGRQGVR